MNIQNYKSNSFCVGQKHYSGTENFVGEIKLKKTVREIKLLVFHFSIWNRKKSMMVNKNTTTAEGIGEFSKYLGKLFVIGGKKLAKNVWKDPGERWKPEPMLVSICI